MPGPKPPRLSLATTLWQGIINGNLLVAIIRAIALGLVFSLLANWP